MTRKANSTFRPTVVFRGVYRILLLGTLLTALLAILAAAMVSHELRKVHGAFFTTQTSSESIREAFDAAYRYGQGEETYGLPPGALHPASFERAWAKESEQIARRVVRQPWYTSYKAGVQGFRRNGLVGFLKRFDAELNSGAMLFEDPVFRAFAEKNRLPLDTERQRTLAVSRYMATLGYIPDTASSFRPLNRLLIANFIAPGEARGYRESMGMDKLTHYYHAKLRAGDEGRIRTLLWGIGIELSELFLGHHKEALILPTLRNPGRFHLFWVDGWPRFYPEEAFYRAHQEQFGPPRRSYAQWRLQAERRFFSWADLAANLAGGSSVPPSITDLAVTGFLFAMLGSALVRLISGGLRAYFGVKNTPLKRTGSTPDTR